MNFKDYFSTQAADYAKFRPHYPPEMFAYLAGLSPERDLAWDCGTGNGQAAIGLAAHFQQVIATDASGQQIASAEQHPAVTYRVAPAEASGIRSHSVDLILVAQAFHWFDAEKFFAEARRVGRSSHLAVAAYNLLEISGEIDTAVGNFYHETTGPFWPPERAIIESNYEQIAFPFPELPPQTFAMQTRWTLPQLFGYLRTWSATQRFIAERGFDPVEQLADMLHAVWKNPAASREVRWPLKVRTFIIRD